MAKVDKPRAGVMLYFADFRAFADVLDDAKLGELIRAVADYGQYGTLPDFDDDALKMAFNLYKPRVDADGEAYIKKTRHSAYMSYKADCVRTGVDAQPEQEWVEANYRSDLLGAYQVPNRFPKANQFNSITETETDTIPAPAPATTPRGTFQPAQDADLQRRRNEYMSALLRQQ